ncbi:hypothetical protein MDAP_002629 [Mitosporidium daphniae]
MKILTNFALIYVGLLAHTVSTQKLGIRDLFLFIGDDFTPEVFEEQNRVAANEAIKIIFSISRKNPRNKEYAISSGVYDKIIYTIIQSSNFEPSDLYKKVKDLKPLPYDTNLKVFGDQQKSVVFYCGPTVHAILCEIFKVASPNPKYKYLWKVLVYNSGDRLEHHPEYHVGPKIKYSPVVI